VTIAVSFHNGVVVNFTSEAYRIGHIINVGGYCSWRMLECTYLTSGVTEDMLKFKIYINRKNSYRQNIITDIQ
jgi:hypothetical protein